MYRLLYFQIIIVSLLFLGGPLSCAKFKSAPSKTGTLSVESPAYASYLIENEWIQLENGRAEWQAAPGSASTIKVALLGKATFSDLNNDRNADAVVVLTYQGGGSGTFFYLAAAIFENGNYQGTNGILLGDRIGQPAVVIRNGLITVNSLDRRPDEPMANLPNVLQTRYVVLEKSILKEIKPAADEAIYQGWLTVGHEVRSFLPCEDKDDLWFLGESPALPEIITGYNEQMSGFPPYTPVFAILAGRKAAPPEEGFGAEYRGAFFSSQVVRIWPKGNCRSDVILLDTPMPGAGISSPLIITGRARGTWFFEGDFPVMLLNAQGEKIAESYATAKGEWMTEKFVDFEGIIQFNNHLSGQRGTLILKKDNPTGLARFDDFLATPIHFK